MNVRVFSNPREGNFVGLMESFSCLFFRKTLEAINAQADRSGAPRLQFDQASLTPARLSTRAFRPEFGAVWLGLHQGVAEADWPWISGQMQVGAFLCELLAALDLEIRGRYPLAIAGHVVRGDHLIIRGDQDQLEVRGDAGEVMLRLTKVAPEEIAPVWAEHADTDIIRLGSGSVATISDGRWTNAWYPMVAPVELTPDPASSRRTIESAMAFLEQHLPAHYLWICFVLREVTLLRDMGVETTASQSFMTWPGYVQLSQSTMLQNIIMLLHECSHQYFHMLLWRGSLAKKDAPDAYSILKGTKRPLEKLLLGYHAFGNVLLALVEMKQRELDLDRRELDRQIESTGYLVADLDAEIEPRWEQFLEERGKDLYLPLRERLAVAVKLPPPRRERDLSMVHD